MSSHRFSPDMQMLFFSERAGQNTVEYAVYLSDTAKRYTLARYRTDDVYANPGSHRDGARRRAVAADAAPAAAVDAAAAAPGRRRHRASSRPTGQRVLPGHDLRQERRSRSDRRRSSTRSRSRPARRSAIYESDNNGVFERVSTVLDPDARRFIVSREGPTEVAAELSWSRTARARSSPKNKDYTPGPHARRKRALHRRAAGRVQVQGRRSCCRRTTRRARGCRRCSGSIRASSRTRRTTTVRIARSTRTRSRTSARGRWSSSCASATPSSSPTRRSSARRGR